MNYINKKTQKNKGFTLIEIVIVIAIISILALILGPNLFGYTQKAREAEVKANLKTIHTAAELVDKIEIPLEKEGFRNRVETYVPALTEDYIISRHEDKVRVVVCYKGVDLQVNFCFSGEGEPQKIEGDNHEESPESPEIEDTSSWDQSVKDTVAPGVISTVNGKIPIETSEGIIEIPELKNLYDSRDLENTYYSVFNLPGTEYFIYSFHEGGFDRTYELTWEYSYSDPAFFFYGEDNMKSEKGLPTKYIFYNNTSKEYSIIENGDLSNDFELPPEFDGMGFAFIQNTFSREHMYFLTRSLWAYGVAETPKQFVDLFFKSFGFVKY